MVEELWTWSPKREIKEEIDYREMELVKCHWNEAGFL